ncbi:uncharacterized protein LOC119576793 [Penaeus monodon]|uniref:uncharacterized protein LOC119576793 n=1 Tax=Penaeus monodon TaxID=6687 RepID=UPI0018A7B32A|nr:uncharacterized protein LOC119576793 [Penaeus monodon]
MVVQPSMLLVVAAVALWSACTAMKVRYACPAMDVCIPWGTCQEENRFRQSPTSPGIRYMCGLTVGSEDHVCCNTTKLLPEAFEPTFEHWYYAQTEGEDDAAFAVVPWPGFGTVPITLDTAVEPEPDGPDEEPNRLCPDMSFCVPAVLCPHTFITYSMVEMALFGLQNARYECGTIGETATFACCQSHVVVTALFEYVRKFEEEFKDNFIMASGENSFLQIISEDEESKKSSLLNLFRFRLSSYTRTSFCARCIPCPLYYITF